MVQIIVAPAKDSLFDASVGRAPRHRLRQDFDCAATATLWLLRACRESIRTIEWL